MKGLTDIPGIRVGHVSDFEAITGCTVILCEQGAVAGVDIRGSATGTQEIDVLNPQHVTPKIHGLCLAGGSAFGLEAACGVRRYLERKGIGYETRAARIPLVPSAILYDLSIGKPDVRPTREMGEAACIAATSDAVREGNAGAGTGATVGKVLGMPQAMKGGVGSATIELTGGVLVSALVATNPFGDVLENGKIIAGARTSAAGLEFADTAKIVKQRRVAPAEAHTTLAVVATNALLTKVQATKLAQLAQHGMIRSISPVHTIYDGDIVFALSLGNKAADVTALGVAAAEVLSEAIVRSVKAARTLGGVPSISRA